MKAFAIASFLLSFIWASAQGQTLSGSAMINAEQPAVGATFSLHRSADSSLVKLVVTDSTGRFKLNPIDAGKYFLVGSFVGHQDKVQDISIESNKNTSLAPFIFVRDASELKGVTVVSRKPLIRVQGEKLVLQVDGSITAGGNHVLDVLRKSPGVSVSHDEKLALNGKAGVQVLIDGRPVRISGDDLASYLKSIQANEVESIELIASPGAKYEAAGSAGIINIKLKKNKAYGLNGSISADYGYGYNGRGSIGVNFNQRSAKLNIYGGYSHGQYNIGKTVETKRAISDTTFYQASEILDKSSSDNFKIGADFTVNKRNTIGMLANLGLSAIDLQSVGRTDLVANSGFSDRYLLTNSRMVQQRDRGDLNFNYSFTGAKNNALSVNLDYGYYRIGSEQLVPNYYHKTVDNSILFSNKYKILTPSDIDVYSAKIDYEHPFANGKVSIGAKSTFVETSNNLNYYNFISESAFLDNARSNKYNYKENVNAGYLNYVRTWSGITIQAGARFEHTAVNGIFIANKDAGSISQFADTSISRKYLNFFPSLSLNYSTNADHQFGLSVSRRLDRPDYKDMNPFDVKIDDYLIQRGNPYLTPQFTTSITGTYTFKQRLNTTLTYNKTAGVITWITDTFEVSKSTMMKRNIASNSVLALNVSCPFQYKSYSSFVNINASMVKYRGNLGEGRNIDEVVPGINLFTQHTLKFSKGWAVEASGFVYSSSLQEGTMQVKPFWSVDAGVQKKIVNDKMTIRFSVSDIFNSLGFRISSNFAGQQLQFFNKSETRVFKLGMSFRLGSNEVKSARQRLTGLEDEMKRAK